MDTSRAEERQKQDPRPWAGWWLVGAAILVFPAVGWSQRGLPYLAPEEPEATESVVDPPEDPNTAKAVRAAPDSRAEPSTDVPAPTKRRPSRGRTTANEEQPDSSAVAAEEPVPRVESNHRPESFGALWNSRRQALTVGDHKAAQTLLAKLLNDKRQAGWPNMFVFGKSLSREADVALAAGKVDRGLELAAAGIELAPDLPTTHFALARAAWAKGDTGLAVGSWWSGVWASWTEPPLLRGRLGNMALVVALAFLIAAAAAGAAAFFRYIRVFIHDIYHLLPTGATRIQAVIFGIAAFSMPMFFRLGPVWWLVIWSLLLGWHYTPRDRIAAILVLVFLAALPLALPSLTGHLEFPGSTAESAYLAARDMGAEEASHRLAALKKPTPSQLYILGLRAQWSGDLERAADLLGRAERAGNDDPRLLTALGNIRFGLGDPEGAVRYYEKAIAEQPKHVVAYFNLSHVYHAQAESKKANEAYRLATELDYVRVEEMKESQRKAGGDAVQRAEVPRYLYAASPRLGAAHTRMVEQLWTWLSGRPVPRWVFAAVAFVGAVLLLLLSWIRVLLHPASDCSRCGQPACTRCNPELPNQAQCGQCFHAFVAKESVDPQSRVLKEIAVHRHQARQRRIRRVATLLIAGQIVSGDTVKGLFLAVVCLAGCLGLLLARGVLVDPVPYLSGTSWLSTVLLAVLVVGIWALSFWDAHRKERG